MAVLEDENIFLKKLFSDPIIKKYIPFNHYDIIVKRNCSITSTYFASDMEENIIKEIIDSFKYNLKDIKQFKKLIFIIHNDTYFTNTDIFIDDITINTLKRDDQNIEINIMINDLEYDINITEKKISNIIETDDCIQYYSAYGSESELDLLSKEFIWCSATLDQALLHPFNRNRLKYTDTFLCVSPIIYRFELNSLKILKLENYYNNIDNIFSSLLSKDCIKIIKEYYFKKDSLIPTLKTKKQIEDTLLSQENNYRILLILKYFNTCISKDINKIYGYYNYYDQNEFAFLLINQNIKKDTIIKSEYKSFKYTDDEEKKFDYTFPLDYDIYSKITNDGTRYGSSWNMTELKRMGCNFIKQIEYQNFDDLSSNLIYNCNSKSIDIKYYKKYIMYKNKYLLLKKSTF
jgi:hypothetical protein